MRTGNPHGRLTGWLAGWLQSPAFNPMGKAREGGDEAAPRCSGSAAPQSPPSPPSAARRRAAAAPPCPCPAPGLRRTLRLPVSQRRPGDPTALELLIQQTGVPPLRVAAASPPVWQAEASRPPLSRGARGGQATETEPPSAFWSSQPPRLRGSWGISMPLPPRRATICCWASPARREDSSAPGSAGSGLSHGFLLPRIGRRRFQEAKARERFD